LEGLEISIGIVGDSVFPASKQDTDPFKSQGAHGDVVIFASGDLGLVVGLSPGAETDRVRSELVKRLPLELWASPAEMDAGTLAAGDAHGAMPFKVDTSLATSKRSRSVPKAVNNRGASAGPAPGKLSKRKLSG